MARLIISCLDHMLTAKNAKDILPAFPYALSAFLKRPKKDASKLQGLKTALDAALARQTAQQERLR